MQRGLKVEGGDRLGKTIIFARNHDHAKYIVDRFNALFPAYRGQFCHLIDYSVNDADGLIGAFSDKDKTDFQIAVSVDMLDTGIDIPEVVNLVFFKRVLSKAKFWQMIGRGTRLRPDLFGPGDDKAFFYIFDFCENFVFFGQNPADVDPPLAASLGQQVFSARLRLVMALPDDGEAALMQFRADLVALLIGQVQGLDSDSFLVRHKAEVVDCYRDPARWIALNDMDLAALHTQIAPLMLEKNTHESARRFDKLLIDSQLAFVQGQATRYAALSEKGQQLAKGLQKKGGVPAVAQQMALIQQAANSRFWATADTPVLETVRLRLRDLVQNIDKEARKPLYTNLTDEITGPELTHEPLLAYANSEAYEERMERILRSNVNHLTVRKLRMNQPITEHELNELERLLFADSPTEAKAQFEAAMGQKPLGIFVRRIVGLDHDAATAAFSEFMENGPLNPAQASFIQYLIDYLTENGSIVDKAELFKPPFTDLDSNGVDGVFGERAPRLIQLIETVNSNAQARA